MNSDKIWYFNHPEARNFGATKISLDKNDDYHTLSMSFAVNLLNIDSCFKLIL